jgi:hypothetical protein
MSKASRDKGANGEREVVSLLADELGIAAKRQLDQSRDGGCDILIEVAGKSCAIEVKRVERSKPLEWLRQVEQVATDLHMVLWRPSRTNWIGIVPWETLVTLLRERGVNGTSTASNDQTAKPSSIKQLAPFGDEVLALMSDGKLWRLDSAAQWHEVSNPGQSSVAQTFVDESASRARA